MQIIVDFSELRTNRKMLFLQRRHLLLITFLAAVFLAVAVYFAALALASYWVNSNNPIVSSVVRAELEKLNEDRQRLWVESISQLQDDIASANARVHELYRKGREMAQYLGLPGDDMFADDTRTIGPPPPPKPPPETPEENAALMTDELLRQAQAVKVLEKKYAILQTEGVARRVRTDTIPMKRPLLGRSWQTSGYGYRKDPFTGRRAFHVGVDYAARIGTPIIAAAAGIVVYTGRLGNYGNAVHVYHGEGLSTLYGHMKKIGVERWQYVRRGEQIGTVGSTGRSTGPHLHYEIRLKNRPQPVFTTIRKLRKKHDVTSGENA